MIKTWVGAGFFLLFNIIPLAASAGEPTLLRCKGQVNRQYLNPESVKDSIGFPVAIVGSKTFQEDLRRIAVASDGQVVELSYENYAANGVLIELRRPSEPGDNGVGVFSGKGWFHFDGGYSGRIVVSKEDSGQMKPAKLIVKASLLKEFDNALKLIGSDSTLLPSDRGYVTVENQQAIRWLGWLLGGVVHSEAQVLQELIWRGLLEDGVVTRLEVDCQLIHRKKLLTALIEVTGPEE